MSRTRDPFPADSEGRICSTILASQQILCVSCTESQVSLLAVFSASKLHSRCCASLVLKEGSRLKAILPAPPEEKNPLPRLTAPIASRFSCRTRKQASLAFMCTHRALTRRRLIADQLLFLNPFWSIWSFI